LRGPDLTAADIHVGFPLEAASRRLDPETTRYPNIASFIERFRQRPADQRAVERGGPTLMPE
jgi:glutathione S-transferase